MSNSIQDKNTPSSADAQVLVEELTPQQRTAAFELAADNARRSLHRPTLEEFESAQVATYSASTRRRIEWLIVVLLVSAFAVSAARIFIAGSNTYQASMQNASQDVADWLTTFLAVMAGMAFVALSEATVLLGAMARRVLFHNERKMQIACYVPILVGSAMAFTANAIVAAPTFDAENILGSVWDALDTAAPTIMVLFAGLTLAKLELDAAEVRAKAQVKFAPALKEYQAQCASPASITGYQADYLPNAIWATIMNVARRKRDGRRDMRLRALRDMPRQERTALVQREIDAVQWFQPGQDGKAAQQANESFQTPPLPTMAGAQSLPSNGKPH